jgi:hypothetical protein
VVFIVFKDELIEQKEYKKENKGKKKGMTREKRM